MQELTRRQAVIELIFAGALWGFGFIATIWALRSQTPSEALVLRFALAFGAGEILWWIWRRGQRASWISDFRLAIPAGLLLAALLLPQTIGLQFTTAAKSGFLTTLYVVLVPILGRIFFRTPTRWGVYVRAALALVGAFLLMDADLSGFNPGDLWTLLCAVFAAAHILYIGRISSRIHDPFRFNNFQSLFCLAGVLPLLFFQNKINLTPTGLLPWLGILTLALGSSIIGFTIQVRTQKVLSSTAAAMLFLLESPFALLFGILFLSEGFTAMQAAGAILILLTAAQSARAD